MSYPDLTLPLYDRRRSGYEIRALAVGYLHFVKFRVILGRRRADRIFNFGGRRLRASTRGSTK